MIDIIFKFGTELVFVRVHDSNCFFRTSQSGYSTIDGLKLDYKGVCREHPDLELRKDWREEAIKRFKEKMKNYQTEKERAKYIIEDLSKVGYVPFIFQQNGRRPIKLG